MNKELNFIVALALKEDLGSGDVSANLLVDKKINASIVCRESAVICGVEYAQAVFLSLNQDIEINWMANDGDIVEPTQVLCTLSGSSKQDADLTFHLALANEELLDWVIELVGDQQLEISVDEAHIRMQSADLVLVASGTAALELALVGVPMVVVYKLSAMSYFIASRLIKSKYISLPNVIADKALVPELIQDDANAQNIASQAMNILSSDKNELIAEFSNIHQRLSLNASEEAARLVLEFINE